MPISRGTDLLGAGTQFFCSIVDYEQIRDAGSLFPHTQYVVTTEVSTPEGATGTFTVARRFTDFEKLHRALPFMRPPGGVSTSKLVPDVGGLVKKERMDKFEKWLQDAVAAFGEESLPESLPVFIGVDEAGLDTKAGAKVIKRQPPPPQAPVGSEAAVEPAAPVAPAPPTATAAAAAPPAAAPPARFPPPPLRQPSAKAVASTSARCCCAPRLLWRVASLVVLVGLVAAAIYFDALSDHRAEMVALGHHAGVIALGIVVVVAILPIFATGGSESTAMR